MTGSYINLVRTNKYNSINTTQEQTERKSELANISGPLDVYSNHPHHQSITSVQHKPRFRSIDANNHTYNAHNKSFSVIDKKQKYQNNQSSKLTIARGETVANSEVMVNHAKRFQKVSSNFLYNSMKR